MGFRISWILFLVAVQFFCTASELAADTPSDGDRFALLIGNENYSEEIGALKTPLKDIALIRDALIRVGFKDANIQTVGDADRVALLEAFDVYAAKLKASGKDTVGIFYYSGHGAADSRRENYVIPTDVTELTTSSFRYRSVSLRSLLDTLSRDAPEAKHFVIFDACRSSLKIQQSDTKASVEARGFSALPEIPGMLIAFATAEGQLASDAGDNAGPYAAALAAEIVKPGLEAITVFRNVQLQVSEKTNQKPWTQNTYIGAVYFAGREPSQEAEPNDIQSEAHGLALVSTNLGNLRDSWDAITLATRSERSAVQAVNHKNLEELPFQQNTRPDVDKAISHFLGVLELQARKIGKRSGGILYPVTAIEMRNIVQQAYIDARLTAFEYIAGGFWTREQLIVQILSGAETNLGLYFEGLGVRGPSIEDLKRELQESAMAVYVRALELADVIGISHSFGRFLRTIYENSDRARESLWTTGADNNYERLLSRHINSIGRDYFVRDSAANKRNTLELYFQFRFRARRVLYDCLNAWYLSMASEHDIHASDPPATNDVRPADQGVWSKAQQHINNVCNLLMLNVADVARRDDLRPVPLRWNAGSTIQENAVPLQTPR